MSVSAILATHETVHISSMARIFDRTEVFSELLQQSMARYWINYYLARERKKNATSTKKQQKEEDKFLQNFEIKWKNVKLKEIAIRQWAREFEKELRAAVCAGGLYRSGI